MPGYDVVSVTTNDHNFNTTIGGILPWRTDSNLGCEPHQFQLGDTFRTNISAFSYTIDYVQPADFATPSAVQGGVSYSNNVLNDCEVLRYETVVKPGDLSITATVSRFVRRLLEQNVKKSRRRVFNVRRLLACGRLQHGGEWMKQRVLT
jgi:hypothetical protein